MTAEHIAALKHLWQQAFGDAPELIDSFLATGFSEDRCHYLMEDGRPVSVLYRFDCYLNGHKLAYIYAVATEKAHRGKGLARKLMEKTHAILKQQGYAGAILVPGSQSLFDFYSNMGYRKAATITEFPCTAADTPTPLFQISAREYAALRQAYLPQGGVVQEDSALDFFATYGAFYRGKDFLLAGVEQDGVFYAREFLGDTALCGNILCTLGLSQGVFRTPGANRDFAMYYPLQEGCPAPYYFGFALD